MNKAYIWNQMQVEHQDGSVQWREGHKVVIMCEDVLRYTEGH